MNPVEATLEAFLVEHPEWRDQTLCNSEGNLSASLSAAIAYINWLVDKGFANSPQEVAKLRQKIMAAEAGMEAVLAGPEAIARMVEFLIDEPEWQRLLGTEAGDQAVLRMTPEGMEAYLVWLVKKKHLKQGEANKICKSMKAVLECL